MRVKEDRKYAAVAEDAQGEKIIICAFVGKRCTFFVSGNFHQWWKGQVENSTF
jgi:hypothetical protein